MIKIILWTIIVVFLASLIAAFVSLFCKRYRKYGACFLAGQGMAGQGTGQCPTHFSQATGETRLFRRTLTCTVSPVPR